jgi:hypothetical protein
MKGNGVMGKGQVALLWLAWDGWRYILNHTFGFGMKMAAPALGNQPPGKLKLGPGQEMQSLQTVSYTGNM